jgi:transposase
MAKPDNRERNARIIAMASQGKGPAEIARALGLSPGVVLGVLHRARQAGRKAAPSVEHKRSQEVAADKPKPDVAVEEANRDKGDNAPP